MGLFNMLGTTARNLFQGPATVRYPFTPKTYVENARGSIRIDESKCILCMICDKRCPTGAIHVDREKKTWQIERMRCIWCNFCVEQCPKKCLGMDPQYTPPATAKVVDTHAIPYVPPAPKKPVEAAAPITETRQPEPPKETPHV